MAWLTAMTCTLRQPSRGPGGRTAVGGAHCDGQGRFAPAEDVASEDGGWHAAKPEPIKDGTDHPVPSGPARFPDERRKAA